jgi:polyketide cyclase/dehydrase/lipid transport protein
MTTLRRDIDLDITPEEAWGALRDFGALHERLVRGFVTTCESDGHERVITFANGLTVRELLVGIDDEHRRLAYAIVDGFVHYQGTAEIVPLGQTCRFVWHVDLLPDERADDVATMMAQGAAAIRRTMTGH